MVDDLGIPESAIESARRVLESLEKTPRGAVRKMEGRDDGMDVKRLDGKENGE